MATAFAPFEFSVPSPVVFPLTIAEARYVSGTNAPIPGYAFDKGVTEYLYIRPTMDGYVSGNISLLLQWYSLLGAITGNVQWVVDMFAVTPGDAQSMQTKAFAATQSTTTTVNATASALTGTTVVVTSLDGLAAGDYVVVRVQRGTDTMGGKALIAKGSVSYTVPTAGDVTGPASSTDNAVVRFDLTTGKLLQNSVLIVGDTGDITGAGTLNTRTIANWVDGPASAVSGTLAAYNGTTGKLVNDSGVVAANIATMAVVPSEMQRIYRSSLPTNATAGAVTTSAVAYFLYMGFTLKAITVSFVEFFVTVVGAGAQTAEVGLFSTTSAPAKNTKSLTKIVATGTVDSLTAGTGVKRNTSSLAQVVAAGTHLWCGLRTAMATTQPSVWWHTADLGNGTIMETSGSGALTGAGPFAGAIPTISITANNCPVMRVTLD